MRRYTSLSLSVTRDVELTQCAFDQYETLGPWPAGHWRDLMSVKLAKFNSLQSGSNITTLFAFDRQPCLADAILLLSG